MSALFLQSSYKVSYSCLMQSLLRTSKSEGASSTAREVLETAPLLVGYIRRHMRQFRQGLSIPQFRALVKVRNEPGASLSAVAEHLGASLPTASRIVANLVSAGLMLRTSSVTDRRLVALHLSERGRAVIETAHAATQTQMETDLAGFSDEDRAMVRGAMVLLRRLFEGRGFPGTSKAMGGPWVKIGSAGRGFVRHRRMRVS